MSNGHAAYIDGFVGLIQKGRQDCVRDALLARLDGRKGEVHGLVSPPLTQVEPDHVALLYAVYGRLAAIGDTRAIEHFRRVLVEQLGEALADFATPVARITDLGRLIAYCGVADSRPLAEQLRLLLWGFLTTRLPKPFPDIFDLKAEIRRRARIAFDLWLAGSHANLGSHPNLDPTDPRTGMSEPHVALIRDALNNALKKFAGSMPPWSEMDLLFLLYRGIMKAAPEEAGRVYFAKICALAAGADGEVRRFRNRWIGVCWEYGKVFANEKDWAAMFFEGLSTWIDDTARYDGADALRDALSVMGEPAKRVMAILAAKGVALPEAQQKPSPEPGDGRGDIFEDKVVPFPRAAAGR